MTMTRRVLLALFTGVAATIQGNHAGNYVGAHIYPAANPVSASCHPPGNGTDYYSRVLRGNLLQCERWARSYEAAMKVENPTTALELALEADIRFRANADVARRHLVSSKLPEPDFAEFERRLSEAEGRLGDLRTQFNGGRPEYKG